MFFARSTGRRVRRQWLNASEYIQRMIRTSVIITDKEEIGHEKVSIDEYPEYANKTEMRGCDFTGVYAV